MSLSHGQVYIISRECPEITGADLKTYAKEIDISMAKEWTSWNDHHIFIQFFRNKAVNVIDARCLHKWKIVDGKKVIKSRLCARGFKPQQRDHVTTSASIAARWTQRMVCSVAANHGWKISVLQT